MMMMMMMIFKIFQFYSNFSVLYDKLCSLTQTNFPLNIMDDDDHWGISCFTINSNNSSKNNDDDDDNNNNNNNR